MSLKALAIITPETDTHTLGELERHRKELRCDNPKMLVGLTRMKK
jgi:hypothetical protein